MPKNIVICSDGTGNTTIKGRGSNVFKLYEAVDTNRHRHHPSLTPQIAFYDDGIGTENLRWFRTMTSATGIGLGRNIRQLYAELVRVYERGDSIYLFGFSRGAFTVRMLARMIGTCGVLAPNATTPPIITDTELQRVIRVIYWQFLNRDDPPCFNRWFGGACPATKQYSFHQQVPIKFIGVWDTVDAVGLPQVGELINRYLWRFKALDCDVLDGIDRACHALAIDDERSTFHPLLWNEQQCGDPQKIEQVWFSGVHANVGGGYPRQGMSLVALNWMMARAKECGLGFIPTQSTNYQELENVDDRLYDSRRGLQIFYTWKPRDIDKICREHGTEPRLHISVCERLARRPEGYAPLNIPQHCQVVPAGQSQAVAAQCATAIATGYQQAGIPGPSLLATEQKMLQVGSWSYWLFVVAALACIAAGLLAGAYAITHWLRAGVLSPLQWAIWMFGIGLIVLVIAWLLASWTDRRFERRAHTSPKSPLHMWIVEVSGGSFVAPYDQQATL